LEPFGLDLPAEAPLDAVVRGTLDLNWLGDMLLPEIQLLTGVMDLDVQLTGALSAPEPSGSIKIDDASYQHLQQGVLLRDIAANITLDKEFLHLQSLTATDGNAGTLAGEGRARLDSGDGFPFSFSLRSSGMNLIDSAQVTAGLAELQLDISGSTTAQEVQGHLTFASVEVRLTDMGGPSVVDLNVVEVNDPTKITARAEPAETAAASPPSLLLDVEARFPARVFVRGRGLDSEWGGHLNLTGSARAPTVRGDVTLHRGRLDLLGRRFTLSEESVIQFFGTQPPMPYVDIRATQTGREGDTFTLNARGVAPDIEFHLSSDPPLPEDEILAQMLFGRTLTNITPIQAAKLALAARELAGQGGGIDFFGTARDIFQLDDLDIVSSEQDNNMSLRTGKYLTERVYLRLDSDLSTGGEEVSADVELTPRINLESKVGSKGSGLGLFWKYDY
jgi:translocation and assembly module TamB